jgi:predicted nucleotide-binding protein
VTIKSALRDLRSGLLDLQAADYNTYARPVARMAKALDDTELKPIADALADAVDFDAFVAASGRTGGMAGSETLKWPTDRERELGLAIVLIRRGAQDAEWLRQLAHTYYWVADSRIIASIRKLTTSVLVPFERDLRTHIEESGISPAPKLPSFANRRSVFIVHGHDEGPREAVARFIEGLRLEAIILHEQASRGMTIPEKLAAQGDVGFAVILLTPDDVGRSKDAPQERPRARQNVILELGYFLGRLGRPNVFALLKGDVEIPSDFLNVVYAEYDGGGAWKQMLARELDAAGYEIDWNRVMRSRGAA